jgi:uncharacterized protein YukE
MRRVTRFARWQAAAAAAAAITMLAAACGSSGTTSGSSAPSATASHSASSPAQSASTALCQDHAALQASLANLAHVSGGTGALKQAKADLKDAQANLTALTGEAHGAFSTQINALKSALTTLQTAVKGGDGDGSVADVRTASGGVTKAATNGAANAQASSRKVQPAAVRQAAVILAECGVRSQPAWGTLVPIGRLRSSPTLTFWITLHGRPGVAVLLVCASAP